MNLREYLDLVRAHKWQIISTALVVTLVALVAGYLQPASYEGEAKVLISERDTGAAIFGAILPELSSQPERGLRTQVELMTLRPLAEETVRKLDLRTDPESLLRLVDVQAAGQTNIVTIRAVADDPSKAAGIANSMAEEFVEWSKEYKRESLTAASAEVQLRLDGAKAEVLELARKVNAEGRTDQLAAELEIATGAYTALAEKLEQLRINEQLEIGSGKVVSTAVVRPDPVSPRPLRNGAIGLISGIVLGVGIALLSEHLDNSVKTDEELEGILGAPVLGHIPTDRASRAPERRLAIVESPGSSTAEGYRVLRNSLDFINFQHDIKTVLVASAIPAEGKSTVSANLAASLAQAGQKVVLMSCDFRRPTTEQFFGVANTIGLSDVLTGSHELAAALQRPGEDHLVILTSGKMPPNPSELLGSKKMQELVGELEEWADWVVIDAPPLLAVADPAAVARWVDGVLVVMRAGACARDAATRAKEMLDNVGARVIGAAVWDLGDSGSGSGYQYGKYRYGGYYYTAYQGEPSEKEGLVAAARERVTSVAVDVTKGAAQGRAESESGALRGLAGRVASGVARVLAGAVGFSLVVGLAWLAVAAASWVTGWDLVGDVLGIMR